MFSSRLVLRSSFEAVSGATRPRFAALKSRRSDRALKSSLSFLVPKFWGAPTAAASCAELDPVSPVKRVRAALGAELLAAAGGSVHHERGARTPRPARNALSWSCAALSEYGRVDLV